MEQVYHLATLDMAIIVIYFVAMLAFGIMLSKKSESTGDYFLAGRSMTWPLIGFSLFASNISSTTLMGLAGDAYVTGISVFNYEWMAALVLVFFGMFMVPFILRSQVYTMPEYLEKRYNYQCRMYFAILTLFINIIVETAASLYAGGILIRAVFPETPLYVTITILALLAGGYTIIGGLSAVMITDVIQAVILIIASIVLSIIAFDKAGGLDVVLSTVDPAKLSLIRPLDDPGVPWLGLITGVPLLGFYFWCTNQFITQRVLSARDETQARQGAILAGFLKLPVLFIMVLPGTAAILLYPDLENANLVYPTLIFDLLPVGLVGLVIAGFMAALMSQIDSTLNSASTVVTMDFVRPRKPDLSNKDLMKIGKITTFIFMIFAILWAPIIESFESLFKYLQTIFSYAVSPIVCLFIVGAFWKRANGTGGFASLMFGFVAGAIFFVINEILGWTNIHFLYVAPILFVGCTIVLIVVSLMTEAPNEEDILPYTWTPAYYTDETERLKGVAWYRNYRVLSLLLVIATGIILYYFW